MALQVPYPEAFLYESETVDEVEVNRYIYRAINAAEADAHGLEVGEVSATTMEIVGDFMAQLEHYSESDETIAPSVRVYDGYAMEVPPAGELVIVFGLLGYQTADQDHQLWAELTLGEGYAEEDGGGPAEEIRLFPINATGANWGFRFASLCHEAAMQGKVSDEVFKEEALPVYKVRIGRWETLNPNPEDEPDSDGQGGQGAPDGNEPPPPLHPNNYGGARYLRAERMERYLRKRHKRARRADRSSTRGGGRDARRVTMLARRARRDYRQVRSMLPAGRLTDEELETIELTYRAAKARRGRENLIMERLQIRNRRRGPRREEPAGDFVSIFGGRRERETHREEPVGEIARRRRRDNDFTMDNFARALNKAAGVPARRPRRAKGKRRPKRAYRRKYGAFWSYFNLNPWVDLTRQQIVHDDFVDEGDEVFGHGCLIYALKLSGLISEAILTSIKLNYPQHRVTNASLNIICKAYGFQVSLRSHNPTYGNQNRTQKLGSQGPTVRLGLIDNHWFLNDNKVAPLSWVDYRDLVTDEVVAEGFNYYDDARHKWKRSKRYNPRSAFKIILRMKELGQFRQMRVTDLERLGHFRPDSTPILSLEVVDGDTSPVTFVDREERPMFLCGGNIYDPAVPHVYFADFETTTNGECQPYCVAWQREDGNPEKCGFAYGKECAVQFLEALPIFSVVFFHNLSFDFNFIIREVDHVPNILKGSTRTKSVRCRYRYKEIVFKDSYLFISKPLKMFPQMFKSVLPENSRKEIFPYSFYTSRSAWTERDEYPAPEVAEHVVEEDRLEFLERHPNGVFHKRAYAEFYCKQDVTLLRLGFNKYREDMRMLTELDLVNYVSLASFADAHLRKKGCYEGAFFLSGTPRAFISKCVVGGRTMTRGNQKWHVTGELTDYDAVSLYPSGMILHNVVLKGEPHVISRWQLDALNERQAILLPEWTHAYLRVSIISFDKDLAFPLIYNRTSLGLTYENKPQEMYVDSYYLRDIIRYHKVTKFKVIEGYFYDSGWNETIKTVMQGLLDLRNEYKRQGNPIQENLKLLANSSYGINGMKLIETHYRVLTHHPEDLQSPERFMEQNYMDIMNVIRIDHLTDPLKTKFLFCVKRPFHRFRSRPHIASNILSASKAIMNPVFEAADEAGVPIFYEDTDSMQLPSRMMVRLEEKHAELHPGAMPLRGTGPGQFHPDYEISGVRGEVKANEGYFLGKKSYIAHLFSVDDPSVTSCHIRMKGIPAACFLELDPMALFHQLYLGEAHTFNVGLKMRFDLKSNFTVKAAAGLARKVHFEGDGHEVDTEAEWIP